MESLLNNHPQNLSLNDLVLKPSIRHITIVQWVSYLYLSRSRTLGRGTFFSGGTATKLYGSRSRNGVDAIQLELNRQGLRAASADRERLPKPLLKY